MTKKGRPKSKLVPLISLPDRYIIIKQGYTVRNHPMVLVRERWTGEYQVIAVDPMRALRVIETPWSTERVALTCFRSLTMSDILY